MRWKPVRSASQRSEGALAIEQQQLPTVQDRPLALELENVCLEIPVPLQKRAR